MAVALYRSLRIEETQRIEKHKLSKEKVYLGTPKPIEEFTLVEKIHAYEGIDNHIRNGNSEKNKEIYSITEDFLVAIKFAKPVTVLKDNRVVHVKINRSAIAVFNWDVIDKNILDYDDIIKFNRNNKGLGNTAYNYALNNCELIISGRIEEFYILKKFHQDLLFCCNEENKVDFLKILDKVIDPEKQKKINEFCETNLTPIEKLVYRLIYCENLNLYEVAAPVYYSNVSADIYCIYDALFEILLSIMKKAYGFLGVTIPNSVQIKLIEIYNTELNVLCLRYENDKYIKSIDFSDLFIEYTHMLTDFDGSKSYIYNWEIGLEEPIKLEELIKSGKIGCEINFSPLFLYLPKNYNNKINKFNHHLRSNRDRDIYFQKNSTKLIFGNLKYKRDKESYSCEIKVDRNGNIKEKKDQWDDYFIFFNFSILHSELYIPSNYTSIEPIFFSLDNVDKDCFNFYNSSENTHGLTARQYNSQRSEYFSKNRELLYSYADRLIKVFGGRNLENADYNNFLDERLNKRSCKDKIINLIKNTSI